MNSINLEEFGKRIAELRESSSNSQEEICAKLGVTQQTLSRYEKGQRQASLDFVVKASKYFNVSADYLLGLSPTKSPDDKTKAACEVTGLEEEYIETLKAAVIERKMNRDGYEKTSINAVNALFYGITRQPDIIPELAKLLTLDIDLLEMSEEESKQIEVKEINKALDGKGVLLSHSEYFDFLVQMIKNSCNDMIDIIVNHYFGTPPFPHTNMVAKSIVNTVFNHTFFDKSNRLLESIKEDLENAQHNPEEE